MMMRPKPLSARGRHSRATSGLTLGEMLVATLLVTITSSLLVLAVGTAGRTRLQLTTNSQARILCSTLSSIVGNELRFSDEVQVDASGIVTGLKSVEYGDKRSEYAHFCAVDSDDAETERGELALVGDVLDEVGEPTGEKTTTHLLGSSAYGDGARRLTASIRVTGSENPRRHYHVEIAVYDATGSTPQAHGSFDVIPVNKSPESAT